MKDQPRILITRLSALGDCIHTLPIAEALRSHFPNAFLAWVTQPSIARMLQGHPALDVVISVERKWWTHPKSFWETRKKLRDFRFDTSIDPQSLTKSSALGWISGARRRIGFCRGQGRELAPWLNNVHVSPQSPHVVDRYLELLRPLRVPVGQACFRLPHRQDASDRISEFLSETCFGRFALVNPGAGWGSKMWAVDRYAQVCKHIRHTHGIHSIVLWSGTSEQELAGRIVDASNGTAVQAPDTSLCELAAICRRATVFVGSDTGPMHLAAAMGVPCAALYGPTLIATCGPYGAGHQPIQAPCHAEKERSCRGSDNRAMLEITVNDVTKACDAILRVSGDIRVA